MSKWKIYSNLYDEVGNLDPNGDEESFNLSAETFDAFRAASTWAGILAKMYPNAYIDVCGREVRDGDW